MSKPRSVRFNHESEENSPESIIVAATTKKKKGAVGFAGDFKDDDRNVVEGAELKQSDVINSIERVNSIITPQQQQQETEQEKQALDSRLPSSLYFASTALRDQHQRELSAVEVETSSGDDDRQQHHREDEKVQPKEAGSSSQQESDQSSSHQISAPLITWKFPATGNDNEKQENNSSNVHPDDKEISRTSNLAKMNSKKKRRKSKERRRPSFVFPSSYANNSTNNDLLTLQQFRFEQSTSQYPADLNKQQQEELDRIKNEEAFGFLEEFPEESEVEQLKYLRMHFVSTKHAAARLHTTLQAVQVIPPHETFVIEGVENLKSHNDDDDDDKHGKGEKDEPKNIFVHLAKEIFSPQPKYFSPSSKNQNFEEPPSSPASIITFATPRKLLQNNDDASASPFYGASPVQRRVFDKDQRLDYDIWMQQEIEFTQLCFFKVEDVFRCRLMKWRREAMEQATEYTFDCLIDDCIESEFVQRLEIYQTEEASTMELFINVELMRLIARREDFMTRLGAIKCYLRIWPEIVQEKRQVMDEEDLEWELLMKLNQREIKSIAKRPLARFWIRNDAEHANAEREMEMIIFGMQQQQQQPQRQEQQVNESTNTNNDDSVQVPRGLFARRLTSVPDPNHQQFMLLHNTSSIIKVSDEKNSGNAPTTANHQKPKIHHHHPFIPDHNLNRSQALLKSQHEHIYALERRARAQISEERDHEAWHSIFSVGIEREEFFLFRKTLQDRIWLEGVQTRQQFVIEHQKLLMFAKEHLLRVKWSAMENTQWRGIKEGETEDWKTVMNRASLAYHVSGFLWARKSRQFMLREKAGRVISLFLKQRRAVLRIQNMRKNLARFFQRCGRGFMTRKVCCADRIEMLKRKKEAFDELKIVVSFLLSRFLRARFSRGNVALARATREVTRFVNWRKAAIDTRRMYNINVLFPQLQIILAMLYGWYSTKRIVHDEKRLNHAACVLQRSLDSFSKRMNTKRIVMIGSRFLNFVKSRNIVVEKKFAWSSITIKNYLQDCIQNRIKAQQHAIRIWKTALVLQKIGRGSIERNNELRPLHLYKVQEQLYSVDRITKWWKRLKMIEFERFFNTSKNTNSYFSLRVAKFDRILEDDFLVDLQVPKKAATMIQTWWRMIIARRKFCAWKISNFFVRHRLQTEHNFMRRQQQQKKNKSVVLRNHQQMASSAKFFVVGNDVDENQSCCYIVGDKRPTKKKTTSDQNLPIEIADELEEEFYIHYARTVESYVDSVKTLKIRFKFELHEARHREFKRKLSSLEKQEFAVRCRIEYQNFNLWWPTFVRMIAHCKHELQQEIASSFDSNLVTSSLYDYNYFISLQKRKEKIQQRMRDQEQDEDQRTIARGFKIPPNDLILIHQQRQRTRELKMLKMKVAQSEEQEEEKSSSSSSLTIDNDESNLDGDHFLESSTDRIIQLIRKKRQTQQLEEKRRRPLSALLLSSDVQTTTNNDKNIILSSRDWLRQHKQRPFSADHHQNRTIDADDDSDEQQQQKLQDIRHIAAQRDTSRLQPPTGRHFDLYTGVFDVCRWWGNQTMKAAQHQQKTKKKEEDSSPSASMNKISSLQFGGTTLEEVCEEVVRCKPIEILAMASHWFPMNGGAIAALVNTALIHNRKTLKQIHVLTKLDAEFVVRMLRRERLFPEKVAVYSYECDREKIEDLAISN